MGGWVAGGIENNANSVQLQLPTGTELGNMKRNKEGESIYKASCRY